MNRNPWFAAPVNVRCSLRVAHLFRLYLTAAGLPRGGCGGFSISVYGRAVGPNGPRVWLRLLDDAHVRGWGGTAGIPGHPRRSSSLDGAGGGDRIDTFCRSLVLIAFGVTYYLYYDFFPTAGAGTVQSTFAGFSLFIIVPAASRLLRALMNHGYQMPPRDEACGRITPGADLAIGESRRRLFHRLGSKRQMTQARAVSSEEY